MGKKFGEFLRKLREDRGWTLRQVEEKAKVSNAYLSQVERGERNIPNFNVLKRLAEVYGVEVSDLTKVAEEEAKGSNVDAKIEAPDVKFVSRGYEKLSPKKKQALKQFLQYLVQEENKGKK